MEGDRDQDGQVRGRCSLYVEQDQRQTWLTNDICEQKEKVVCRTVLQLHQPVGPFF